MTSSCDSPTDLQEPVCRRCSNFCPQNDTSRKDLTRLSRKSRAWGLTQVFLRDRFAGAHTVDVATNKAWTAASFRTSTLDLANESQPGKPMSGIRSTPRMLAVGGGVVIKGGGSIDGGIGVSGAPGGEADDACARAGIKAIADLIEF